MFFSQKFSGCYNRGLWNIYKELVIVGSKGKIILSADQKLVKFINIDMKNYKNFLLIKENN